MMTQTMIKLPPRILVGLFARSADLWTTYATLETRLGLSRDFVGVISRGDHGRPHDNLLSVIVPPGKEEELAGLMKSAGAVQVAEPAELGLGYKQIPHPGMVEDLELKLPSGREYPATAWPPGLSGYRIRPRTLDTRARVWGFEEVELGYTLDEALSEASRCLKCPDEPCRTGCPAHNDIPGFIRELRQQHFAQALARLRQTTNFPGICSRVCDKARQCEGACTLGKEGDAVAIGMLERFLADWELRAGLRHRKTGDRARPTGKKVAVVGSGPSGLAAAGDLALRGHHVTIFEALPVAGGALAWGIPTFRLPQEVVQTEIDFVARLGVECKLGVKIGADLSLDDLLQKEGFRAVFIGAGASLPSGMGVPGEELRGVYTATEFLSRAKLSRVTILAGYSAPVVGERLAVIGGGNTAMDVAQTALRLAASLGPEDQDQHTTMDVAQTAMRLGFREVTVVYRRSEAEMPARHEEVEGAKEEGTRFRFLTTPIRFIGDANGRVRAMECIEMELGRPDSRGRREPIPKPGSEFILPVDTVVLALGYKPEPILARAIGGPASERSGLVTTDPETGQTSRTGVWAGGDIVTGANTVVRAMVAGKRTAKDIDRYLQGAEG